MAIRSLLVHLADDPRHAVRLDVALAIARAHEAHLTALYTLTPVHMPAGIEGRGASLRYLAETLDLNREKAERMAEEFAEHCTRYGISGEWHHEEGDPLDLLAAFATYADLAIVGQAEPKTLEDRLSVHRPDHLALVAGCPVLVLPREGSEEPPGSRVLVAWEPTRPCVRAVHDAIPFLARAERVTLFSVVPALHDHVPGAEIATLLARHGVEVETRSDIGEGEREIGKVVLATARDLDCDLVVMGAHGRSPLRELVLGGVTHYVLNRATVAVLTSH